MSLEPISSEEAIRWAKAYLGESFIEGLGMNLAKGYVRVRVRTENGEEDIKLSVPRKIKD